MSTSTCRWSLASKLKARAQINADTAHGFDFCQRGVVGIRETWKNETDSHSGLSSFEGWYRALEGVEVLNVATQAQFAMRTMNCAGNAWTVFVSPHCAAKLTVNATKTPARTRFHFISFLIQICAARMADSCLTRIAAFSIQSGAGRVRFRQVRVALKPSGSWTCSPSSLSC